MTTRSSDDRIPDLEATDGATLCASLHADAPLTPALRVSLVGLEELVVARGERGLRRKGRTATLSLPDAFLSSCHARVTFTLGRWQLADAGSKNGSLQNGRPVKTAELSDGDVLELGHAFFVFRASGGARDAAEVVEIAGGEDGLATAMPGLEARYERLRRVAPSDVTVNLRGEVGTGKEVCARAVHALSGRAGPFVAVNCGGLSETLLAAELFGSRRGAYTGATEDRPGLVRAAHGGTLFLDEIGELTPAAQAALLRVLQEREVLPVGATRPQAVDLRLVTATHRDLHALVEEGRFRLDLHTRLHGFQFDLPPLRQRREDLGLLVATLLRRQLGGAAARAALHVRAARHLFAHDWPGNVRELEKALGAALVVAGDRAIAVDDLSLDGRPAAPAQKDAPDRGSLEELLARHGGNVAAVARDMGRAPVQIRRWMRRHGLQPDSYRK